MQTPNKTSSAYNFAMFEASPQKQEPKKVEVKAPELKVAKASAVKNGKPLVIVLMCSLVLAVFMMYIYNRAQVSEINLRISQEAQALEDAQTINTALNAQLSGSVTLDNVEQVAQQELKMQKVNASQEKYIEMSTGTLTEAAQDNENDIFATIQRWFQSITEYLGF